MGKKAIHTDHKNCRNFSVYNLTFSFSKLYKCRKTHSCSINWKNHNPTFHYSSFFTSVRVVMSLCQFRYEILFYLQRMNKHYVFGCIVDIVISDHKAQIIYLNSQLIAWPVFIIIIIIYFIFYLRLFWWIILIFQIIVTKHFFLSLIVFKVSMYLINI